MNPILKDLCVLIRKSTIHYTETCPQNDIRLTDEFKREYKDYLSDKKYDIDFYDYSAVITTSAGLYMFVSNQWFIVASYAVGVYSELMKYKKYLMEVCSVLNVKPKEYVPYLRDAAGINDREKFESACKAVFVGDVGDVEIATSRLWRFATDYTWWSGNKTADRGDFHLSVILNMLNLVNVSQAYIGEIVSDYYNAKISQLVSDLGNFTETHEGKTFAIDDYDDPKEVVVEKEKKSVTVVEDDDEIVISVRTKK